MAAKRGAEAQANIRVSIQNGFHVNSNAPNESYLIPLRLTWMPGPLEPAGIQYPKPRDEKYEFSAKPLSVFTGDFDVVSKFKVPANAPVGPGVLMGKLRYQACSNKECFPPKTVEVKLPFQVR